MAAYEITSGAQGGAMKVVVYGPEGIGKSSFAAQFPDPLFIDTEGSTRRMNVRRMPKPTSWEMIKGEVQEAASLRLCKTIVIDTIDWAEQLCISSICAAHGKSGIEDFGYGKGYVYECEGFAKFLNLLQDVVDSGINVVLTAHAKIVKFEQPDELGSYDRWEMKLGQKTGSLISPKVKEWADMVLFANYKTYAVAVDKDGKKFKAQGGERVMYTSHHPCWDAKNRDGLAPELPFDYSQIAHLFAAQQTVQTAQTAQTVQTVQTIQTPPQTVQQPEPAVQSVQNVQTVQQAPMPQPEPPADIPQALRDLMIADGVTEEEIREVVAQEGYCPVDMPVAAYPPDFISGCLVADWQTVLEKIKEMDIGGVPF